MANIIARVHCMGDSEKKPLPFYLLYTAPIPQSLSKDAFGEQEVKSCKTEATGRKREIHHLCEGRHKATEPKQL